jgi:hypothetical protein
MSTIKQIRKASLTEVKSLLSSTPATISAMNETLTTHFPTVNTTEVQTQYTTLLKPNPEAPNATLEAAIDAYSNTLSNTIAMIQTIECFITLHIPQMEDGNNFGVTVQMTISKALEQVKESLLKKMEVVPSFYSSRADLIDKFGLTKSVVSTTKTTSKSTSTGGKDGDESKESSSEVTDEKSTGSVLDVESKMYPRFLALVKADVNCYINARVGLVECRNSVLMILDNVEKNLDKLSMPKGSAGYGGNSMGMY